MPTLTPDEDVSTHLAANIVSLTEGTNLFLGPLQAYDLKAIPHLAVFVLATGGGPSRHLKDDFIERHPAVDVHIRGAPSSVPHAFRDGQTLAREIFDLLDGSIFGDFCDVQALNGHPSYLEKDDDGHHRWVVFCRTQVDFTP